MKKTYILVSFIILVTMLPITSAMTIPTLKTTIPHTLDADPPEWATGSFVGIVGLTNPMGRPQPYGGHVAGYYGKEDFTGRFAGVIARRNASEATGYIGGYIRGPFLFGIMGNLSSRDHIPIVGIGRTNETHAYFRLMSLVGPTFYIACRYHSL
jgi:hypothetical protein